MLGLDYYVLLFVGFLYWPLFFVRVRDAYTSYELTSKKVIISVIFAIAGALVAGTMVTGPYLGSYFPLAMAAALAPLVVLMALPKASVRRTKAKFLILAAYIHLTWQMLPTVNIMILAIEVIADIVILFLSSFKKRKKALLYKTSEVSIGDMWK